MLSVDNYPSCGWLASSASKVNFNLTILCLLFDWSSINSLIVMAWLLLKNELGALAGDQ